MRNSLWKTTACSLGYLVLALACLIRWFSTHLLARIDGLVGGYFVLRLIGSLHSIASSLGVFRSKPLRQEWWALNSDPEGPRWVMVLMALDLLVFLDYGQWQLTPWLANRVLQIVGSSLYFTVTLWQMWTDSYLARFFNDNRQPFAPMDHGPYHYVRHPRYAAAIAGKASAALIFGSVFGWLLAIAWGMLLLNKIAVEEKHLRKLFGGRYELYARTTAKLIPGIY